MKRATPQTPEDEENHTANMRKKRMIGIGVGVTVVVAVTITSVVLALQPWTFAQKFMDRCQAHRDEPEEVHCRNLLNTFQEAYVGKPQCEVSEIEYDPLFTITGFKHPCDYTMFWSGTDKLVHKYTSENTKCFTLEDTLLGSILRGKEWCGEEGSTEIITSGCPGCDGCENSPVRSFWRRASRPFALHACDNATVMLDGDRELPFNVSSTFGSIEIKYLNPNKVNFLNVIVVKGDKSNCNSPNIQTTLRDALDHRIGMACKDIPKSQLNDCYSGTTSCAGCFSR